jgi:hypothetical protein
VHNDLDSCGTLVANQHLNYQRKREVGEGGQVEDLTINNTSDNCSSNGITQNATLIIFISIHLNNKT